MILGSRLVVQRNPLSIDEGSSSHTLPLQTFFFACPTWMLSFLKFAQNYGIHRTRAASIHNNKLDYIEKALGSLHTNRHGGLIISGSSLKTIFGTKATQQFVHAVVVLVWHGNCICSCIHSSIIISWCIALNWVIHYMCGFHYI